MPLMHVRVENDSGFSLQSFVRAKDEESAHDKLPALYNDMDWIIFVSDPEYAPKYGDDRYIDEITREEAIKVLGQTIKMARKTVKIASNILLMIIMDDIKSIKDLATKRKKRPM